MADGCVGPAVLRALPPFAPKFLASPPFPPVRSESGPSPSSPVTFPRPRREPNSSCSFCSTRYLRFSCRMACRCGDPCRAVPLSDENGGQAQPSLLVFSGQQPGFRIQEKASSICCFVGVYGDRCSLTTPNPWCIRRDSVPFQRDSRRGIGLCRSSL